MLVLFDIVEVMVDGEVGAGNRVGINHVSENEESLEIEKVSFFFGHAECRPRVG